MIQSEYYSLYVSTFLKSELKFTKLLHPRVTCSHQHHLFKQVVNALVHPVQFSDVSTFSVNDMIIICVSVE